VNGNYFRNTSANVEAIFMPMTDIIGISAVEVKGASKNNF